VGASAEASAPGDRNDGFVFLLETEGKALLFVQAIAQLGGGKGREDCRRSPTPFIVVLAGLGPNRFGAFPGVWCAEPL
jgi:hypothetical protein